MGAVRSYLCDGCGEKHVVESDPRGRTKRVERNPDYDDPSDPNALFKCWRCQNQLVPTMPKDLVQETDGGVMLKAIKRIRTTKANLNEEPDNAEMLVSLAGLNIIAGGYTDAVNSLEKAKAVDPYMPEVYYLQAIARLQGKSPKLNKESDVKLAIENCNSAIGFEEEPAKAAVYKTLKAYIQYDFYESKGRMMIPSYKKLMSEVWASGVQDADIDGLFKLLKATKPAAF